MIDTVLLVDDEGTAARHFAPLSPKILRSVEELQRAFDANRPHALWIVRKASSLKRLAKLRGGRHGTQRLLSLGRIDSSRSRILHALFPAVVAADDGVVLLPVAEIAEVIGAPNRDDLFIGGAVDTADRALVLYRGNLDSLVVPLAWFGPRLDPAAFKISDFGQTVSFGNFEAATDAILYEFDPEARRRAKLRRVEQDPSFGGALRRLRKQRGVRRDDFEGISAKEIARIERGDVAKPRAHTVAKLARRLGVEPADIGTY